MICFSNKLLLFIKCFIVFCSVFFFFKSFFYFSGIAFYKMKNSDIKYRKKESFLRETIYSKDFKWKHFKRSGKNLPDFFSQLPILWVKDLSNKNCVFDKIYQVMDNANGNISYLLYKQDLAILTDCCTGCSINEC